MVQLLVVSYIPRLARYDTYTVNVFLSVEGFGSARTMIALFIESHRGPYGLIFGLAVQ